jgi:nitrate reductase (cytochrome), electron transfer subunit
MNEGERPGGPPPPGRVIGIGAAIVVMILVVVVLVPWMADRTPHADYPPVVAATHPWSPIEHEAAVFRMTPESFAVPPDEERRPGARVRTLEDFRALRAYPGAPPRVPHPVSEQESLRMQCNACHARGGYVERFQAYTPVTPHPEYAQCMQCHVEEVVPALRVATDWATTSWPEPGWQAMPGSPPPVPHPLQLRGNCLACHAGPGAVEAIRTAHPERANCLQCHVPAERVDEGYSRPLDRHPQGGLP